MSSTTQSLNEVDRLHKIAQLKKRIVGIYGSGLLTTPLNQDVIQKVFKDDNEDVKAEKNATNKRIIAERTVELKKREPELITELEKLIERIKNARPEYGSIQNLYSSSNAAIEKQKFTCEKCGNKDINNIINDSLRGDSICNGPDNMGCGTVLADHTVEMGAEKRNFEGEEDRNHFGPAPNKLMPDVVNMETSLNIHVNGRENALWKRLSQTQQTVEMNLSKIGKEEKHTREGYKTKQKRQAFALMEEIAANINIHQLVVGKAKEEFTKYRDIRDALHQFEGIVSACLVLAYEELSLVMHLDEVTRSAEITSHISAITANDDVPTPAVEDLALSTASEVLMTKFSIQQVEDWLRAVASSDKQGGGREEYISQVDVIVAHIKGLVEKGEVSSSGPTSVRRDTSTSSTMSVGRKRSLLDSRNDNIFGTTTVSSRLGRYKGTGGGGPSTEAHSLTAGQLLLRCNLVQVLPAPPTAPQVPLTKGVVPPPVFPSAAHFFKAALTRRSHFDTVRVEADRNHEIQTKRLKTEESASLISRNTKLLVPGVNGTTPVVAAVEEADWTATSKSAASLRALNIYNAKQNLDGVDSTSSLNSKLDSAQIVDHPSSSSAAAVVKMELSSSSVSGRTDTDSSEADSSSFLDFDLEDLVGGPVMTGKIVAVGNQFKSVVSNSNNSNVRNGSSNTASVGSPAVANGRVAASPGIAAHVNGTVQVKEEGVAKKVGIKPRPKFSVVM